MLIRYLKVVVQSVNLRNSEKERSFQTEYKTIGLLLVPALNLQLYNDLILRS